jgi:hypothetical protein
LLKIAEQIRGVLCDMWPMLCALSQQPHTHGMVLFIGTNALREASSRAVRGGALAMLRDAYCFLL